MRDGAGRDQRHQHDRGRVVESGLRLERRRPAGAAAAGRAAPRRPRPRRSGEVTAPSRTDSSQDSPSRQWAPTRDERDATPPTPRVASETPSRIDRPHLGPAGRQTALGQDQRQRPEAERVGELGVLEVDPDAALAEGDAHAAGRAAGSAGRRATDTRTARMASSVTPAPDQEERVELVDVEGHGCHLALQQGRRVPSLLSRRHKPLVEWSGKGVHEVRELGEVAALDHGHDRAVRGRRRESPVSQCRRVLGVEPVARAGRGRPGRGSTSTPRSL